jgi:hypothetical protein
MDYWIALPSDLTWYRDEKPSREKRRSEGIDGSGLELKIATFLVGQGWTDEEILAYFDFHLLPRHIEDLQKDGRPTATLSRITAARRSVDGYLKSMDLCDSDDEYEDGEEGAPHTPLHVIENEHNPGTQIYSSRQLRFLALKVVREWQEQDEIHTLTDWRDRIRELSGLLPTKQISMMTARRLTEALIENGYVFIEAINGKSRVPHLTEKGSRTSEPGRWGFSKAVPLRRGSALPALQEVEEQEEVEEELDASAVLVPVETTSGETKSRQRRDPRHLHVEGYRKRNTVNGCYRLRFGGNKIRYFQLLAPIEDAVAGPLWLYLPVGYDNDGLKRFATVVGEEDAADDPLTPIMPKGWQFREHVVVPAVELVKTKDGFEIAEHLDDAGELRPSSGIIAQSEFNFFTPLRAIKPNDQIIEVKGSGKNPRRTYAFTAVAEALALDTDFDFESFLMDMLDPRHLERALGLHKGWFHMPEKRRQLIHRLTKAPGK